MKAQFEICLIFLIGFLMSCSGKPDDANLKQIIEGDWINEVEEHGETIQTYFTFEKYYSSYFYPQNLSEEYSINGDTLKFGWKNNYKFLIKNFSNEHLELVPVNATTGWSDFYRRYPDSTFLLKKIHQKNNLKFKRIGYSSSACHGPCPSLRIELDSSGNLIYHGFHNHVEKRGLYSGKVDADILSAIFRKANTINWEIFEPKKDSLMTIWKDAHFVGFWFQTEDEIFKLRSVSSEISIELDNLSYMLMDLYKHVDLKRDTSILNDFQFEGLKARVSYLHEIQKKRKKQ